MNLNLYVILVAVFVFCVGGAGVAGYKKGYEHAENAVQADAAKAAAAAVKVANENAVIDMQAAAEAEEARWRKRLVAERAKHETELDIERQKAEIPASCPPTVRDFDAQSLDVLQQRIRQTNAGDKTLGTGLRTDGVPVDSGTAGRKVDNGKTVGGQPDRPVR